MTAAKLGSLHVRPVFHGHAARISVGPGDQLYALLDVFVDLEGQRCPNPGPGLKSQRERAGDAVNDFHPTECNAVSKNHPGNLSSLEAAPMCSFEHCHCPRVQSATSDGFLLRCFVATGAHPASSPSMCGRYTIKDVEAAMPVIRAIKKLAREIGPTFNAAPSQMLPVVRLGEDGERELVEMRWGMVPFWDKSEKPKIAPINARAEDAIGKPTFRQSLQRRRCLVPADGFFEWKKLDAEGKLKVPYHIQLRGSRPFMFAGIYEAATDTRPETYAILTTRPNGILEPIHNRMPVILGEDAAAAWLALGPLAPEALAAFAEPFPAEQMETYTVSRLVNNPRNNVPECVVPESKLELELGDGGPNSA